MDGELLGYVIGIAFAVIVGVVNGLLVKRMRRRG
jgi:ribose/xylose/arabinose/galactoside ABC-type transport system permease subunit